MKSTRFAIALLATLVSTTLSVALLSAQAEAPEVDFDQGVSASSILETAQERVSEHRGSKLLPLAKKLQLPPEIIAVLSNRAISRPVKIGPATKPTTPCDQNPPHRTTDELAAPDCGKAVKQVPLGTGWFGPWQPKIYYHPSYQNALQYPPLIKMLPPETAGPLQAEWRDRIVDGNGLIDQARQLEPEDEKLYLDAIWINDESDSLDRESVTIEEMRARYEARCWVPTPPADCESAWQELHGRIGRYNDRVRIYNAKLAEWKRKRDEVKAKGEKLDSEIEAWGKRIDTFSNKAEKALEDAGMTRVRIQAQTGSVVFASAPLSKIGRVTLYEGYQLLGQVYEALSQRERDNRVNAFPKAKEFMEKCAVGGGCAKIEHPEYNNPREIPWGPRIDISVFQGTAFVHDPSSR